MMKKFSIMMFFGLGLTGSAFAYEGVVSVGPTLVVNDPFLKQKGVAVSGEYRPEEFLAVGLDYRLFPDLGDTNWTGLTKQLIEENHVSPDISKRQWVSKATVTIFGLKHSTSTADLAVGFGVGIGFSKTADDLEALDTEASDERAVVTQNQMHPTAGYTLLGEAWWGENGIRFRLENDGYIETVNATVLEMKSPVNVGVEFGRRF